MCVDGARVWVGSFSSLYHNMLMYDSVAALLTRLFACISSNIPIFLFYIYCIIYIFTYFIVFFCLFVIVIIIINTNI